MSTIKVLHVIARMNVGGTARYVEELVKNIPNSALATGHVQDAEVEDPAVESLPVFRIPHLGRRISPIADFKAWRELSNVVREQKPAILHTHTFKAGLIGRLVRGKHVRVHTFHGHLFDDYSFSKLEKFFITFAERLLAKRTDFLVSVGQEVGERLRARKIGSNKNWASVAPGVKEIPLMNKTRARMELDIFESGLLIGWMARMAQVKNPYLLLEVALGLPTTQFVMAGGGDLLDEIRLSAPENVKVIGWANPSIFLSAVDIIVSTSSNEGMPIALIEAQLAGLPVIATDVGSTKEVIDDKVTGLIVENNGENIVNAIERLKISPSFAKELGKSGRIRANLEFNTQRMLIAYLNIYQKLAK